nr:hypothetical protein [uncultured Mediterranean phage uvMED]
MAKFNLENYETVEERLKKFWADYPNGRIFTEVVHITDDGLTVTIRTHGYKDIKDAQPVSTGIAQETKGQGGFANADAWMENCETSSIGRMLANWTYQGSDKARPSREEMSKSVKPDPVKKSTPQVVLLANNMISNLTPAHAEKALDMANSYAKLKKFPLNKEQWSDDEINKYLEQVEMFMAEELKPAETVDEAINSVFDTTDVTEKIMDNMKEPSSIPRTDLTCPFCKGKVFDNRTDKLKPTSPDFKCGAKTVSECSAHTGKFSKSWWITDDLPPEWNVAPF